jgi:hypothetical protein
MGPEVRKLGGYRPGARLNAAPGLNRAIGYVRRVEIVICSPAAFSPAPASKVRTKKPYAIDLLRVGTLRGSPSR